MRSLTASLSRETRRGVLLCALLGFALLLASGPGSSVLSSTPPPQVSPVDETRAPRPKPPKHTASVPPRRSQAPAPKHGSSHDEPSEATPAPEPPVPDVWMDQEGADATDRILRARLDLLLQQCNKQLSFSHKYQTSPVRCVVLRDAIVTSDDDGTVEVPEESNDRHLVRLIRSGSLPMDFASVAAADHERDRVSAAQREGRASNTNPSSVDGSKDLWSGTYPHKKTRHHMKPVRVRLVKARRPSTTDRPIEEAATSVGVFQGPVSGAGYKNVWHTISDFLFTFFHTLRPLIPSEAASMEVDREVLLGNLTGGPELANERKAVRALSRVKRGPHEAHVTHTANTGPWFDGKRFASPRHNTVQATWVTQVAKNSLGGDNCLTPSACRRLQLFDPFERMFGGRVKFTGELPQGGLRFKYLVVGVTYECSPVPTEHVGEPACHIAFERWRDHVLALYGMDPQRSVTREERRCPAVHVMSRQGQQYRWIDQHDEVVAAIRTSYRDLGCSPEQVQVVRLSGRMTFREQVLSVHNRTVLVAGRGGGTGLMQFLPRGGVYLSVSGDDRWNPYRGLEPRWMSIVHHEATLVHHQNPNRRPKLFGGHVDANRCAYKIVPLSALAVHVAKVVRRLRSEVADDD